MYTTDSWQTIGRHDGSGGPFPVRTSQGKRLWTEILCLDALLSSLR